MDQKMIEIRNKFKEISKAANKLKSMGKYKELTEARIALKNLLSDWIRYRNSKIKGSYRHNFSFM